MAEPKAPVPTYMYRHDGKAVEARLFADVSDIPDDEGWVDHPDKAKPAKVKAEKPAK